MTTQWDRSVDLLIAGSGGGGMVAGLAALDCGLEPLIIEKQALVGGSTGLSGGIVWLPNNPLMRADGIADSHEDGLAYLADVVGDIGAPSSTARRETFLTAGYEMINFLAAQGGSAGPVRRLERLLPKPQGRQRVRPGGRGNSVRRGRARELARQSAAAVGQELRVRGADQRAALGPVLQPFAARVRRGRTGVPAHHGGRIRGARLLTNGASLIGQMLKALIDLARRAAGVDERRDGRPHRRRRPGGRRARLRETAHRCTSRHARECCSRPVASRHNAEMRRKYSGNQPNEAQWSIANAGDTGEVLRRRCGWAPRPTCSTRHGGCRRLDRRRWRRCRSLGRGTATAGAIFVDSTGRRFCNESNSYVEVGKAMYANKAVPCWMIFDEGYVRRYVIAAPNPLKRRRTA